MKILNDEIPLLHHSLWRGKLHSTPGCRLSLALSLLSMKIQSGAHLPDPTSCHRPTAKQVTLPRSGWIQCWWICMWSHALVLTIWHSARHTLHSFHIHPVFLFNCWIPNKKPVQNQELSECKKHNYGPQLSMSVHCRTKIISVWPKGGVQTRVKQELLKSTDPHRLKGGAIFRRAPLTISKLLRLSRLVCCMLWRERQYITQLCRNFHSSHSFSRSRGVTCNLPARELDRWHTN